MSRRGRRDLREGGGRERDLVCEILSASPTREQQQRQQQQQQRQHHQRTGHRRTQQTWSSQEIRKYPLMRKQQQRGKDGIKKKEFYCFSKRFTLLFGASHKQSTSENTYIWYIYKIPIHIYQIMPVFKEAADGQGMNWQQNASKLEDNMQHLLKNCCILMLWDCFSHFFLLSEGKTEIMQMGNL